MRKGATILGLWCAAAFAVTGPAQAQTQPSFRTSIGDFFLNTAKSFVIDDIDGDGFQDMIVAIRGDVGVAGGVSILLGQGDGNFFDFRCSPSCDIQTDSVPSALAVADFNKDGHKDIATVDPNSQEIRVLLGTESVDIFDGPAITLPRVCTGTQDVCNFDDDCEAPATCDLHGVPSPANLVAAELNGDANIDLAVVSDDLAGEIAVLLGNGDGTFTGTLQSPQGTGSTTRAVKAADVNNDGKLDLLTANRDSGTISVLLNVGEGNFTAATSFPAGEAPLDLVVGNFTADNNADVVVPNYNTDSLSVLRGDGQGNFAAPTSSAAGAFPNAIDAADFDQDGRLDVVVSNNLSNDVTVAFGNGAGGFARLRSFLAGPGPLDVAAAKLDGDDNPDIIALNVIEQSSYSVLLERPGRSFASGETFRILDNAGPVAVGDINGDGKPDALVSSSSIDGLSVLNPTIDGSMRVSALDLNEVSTAVLLADLDRDGHNELIVAGGSDAVGFVGVARPQGGTFGPLVKTTVGGSPSGLDAADFNEDGLLDVAVTEFRDDSVSVLLSKPDGSFNTPVKVQLHSVGDPDPLQPQAVAAADLDGDGHADLAVTNFRENGVLSIVYGRGNGTFESALSRDGGRRPLAVHVADVDNDGLEDIITANEDRKGVIVHHATAPRTYENKIEITVSGQPMGLGLRDLTGDGVLDIVVPDFTDERVAIKPGGRTTKPYFSSTVDNCPQQGCLESGRNPGAAAAADFNGDGLYDVLSVNAFQAKNAALLFSDLEPSVRRGDGNQDGRVSAADLLTVTALLPSYNRRDIEELRRSGKVDTLNLDGDGDGLLTTVDATGTAGHIFE